MFRITRTAPDRLDIEFGGRIDSERMRALLDELDRASAGIERGRMLYRIHDFEWPTAGAIGVELTRMPALFGLVRRFDRVAVLADESWIRTWSRFEGALVPDLEIKAFAPGDEAAAEAWLAR